MKAPARPPNEEERLEDLATYEILDTLPEDAFDDLARLASTLCDVPMALITFVDEERQWNKACVGLDRDPVDREISFCGHVIANPAEPMIVEDTHDDERFHDNPLVTDGPGFRFYAGVPIVSPRGNALGTVCVLDREPRQLSDEQVAGLRVIADQVMQLLEARIEGLGFAQESQFFQAIIDSLQEHVAILDREGTIVATNEAWDAFARDHHASVEPGQSYLEPVRDVEDEDARRAREGIEALLEGERSTFEMEYPCHGPDERRWFRMTGTAFEGAGDRYLVLAHRDITDTRLHAEQREELITQLSERDQLLEQLGRTLSQVLWIVEPDLEAIPFLGERAREFWEMEPETLHEDPLSWLDRLSASDQERFPGWMEETIEAFGSGEQDRARFDFSYQRPSDDETRWGKIEVFPVRHDGELRLIVGITEDTTEAHRQGARDRQDARQKARLSELQQLAFATSHTLKTEVRRIRSFGQLLSNRAAKGQLDQLDEPVEEMLAGSRRLEALHEGLRKYAEVTQGHAPLQQVDLEALVQEVLAERSDAIEGLQGRADVGAIPAVRGDPEQLRQLLAELVDNAVKFAGEPPVDLSFSASQTGDQVEVTVADDGIGFDPDYAERIFDIFQQLEPQETDGVGVGLTICRRIVENHGGTIQAEAEPGKGASFTFTLPAAGEP